MNYQKRTATREATLKFSIRDVLDHIREELKETGTKDSKVDRSSRILEAEIELVFRIESTGEARGGIRSVVMNGESNESSSKNLHRLKIILRETSVEVSGISMSVTDSGDESEWGGPRKP